MYFIGISGPIASGKSTLAGHLNTTLSNSFVIPFATGVYKLAALHNVVGSLYLIARYFEDLGVDPTISMKAAWMIEEAFKKYPTEAGRKNRKLLQYIGTEVGREFVDKDIWIHALQTNASFYVDSKCEVIISDDMRFPNEAEFVDLHIAIDTESTDELIGRYLQRIQNFPKEYTYSNHASEQQVLPTPRYSIPIGFTNDDVLALTYFIQQCRG